MNSAPDFKLEKLYFWLVDEANDVSFGLSKDLTENLYQCCTAA